MKTIYFKNDIMEIVSAAYNSVNELPPRLCNNLDRVEPITGGRFRVREVVECYKDCPDKYFQALHSERLLISCKSYDVMLHRRPLINWLKYIYFLITKKTIQ
jgi:hypothetical protein